MATVPQQRRLITTIPGPRSQELQARKLATVSAGVSTGLPVYIERASGGILVDVDGNQLIDFGSGIAVTTVGASNPRVVEAVARGRFHIHTPSAARHRRSTEAGVFTRNATGK